MSDAVGSGTAGRVGRWGRRERSVRIARPARWLAATVVAGSAAVLGTATPAGAGSGGSWAETPVPAVAGAPPTLHGVSCAGGACVAVGAAADQAYVLVQPAAGARWTPVTLDVGAVASGLTAVSCTTAAVCVAVGAVTDSSVTQPLVETADLATGPTTWRSTVLPVPAVATEAQATDVFLSGVSCTGPGACVASGSYLGGLTGTGSGGFVETLSAGSWTETTLSGTDWLNGISCAGPGSCVATGTVPGAGTATVAAYLVRSAGGWSSPRTVDDPAAVSAFGSGAFSDALWGVACPRSTWCVIGGAAVPQHAGTARDQSFGVVLRGTLPGAPSTTVHPLGAHGQDVGAFGVDVACLAPAACTAVASSGPGDGAAFATRLQGTSWVGETGGATGVAGPGLLGVTASPGGYVAAGFGTIDTYGSPPATVTFP